MHCIALNCLAVYLKSTQRTSICSKASNFYCSSGESTPGAGEAGRAGTRLCRGTHLQSEGRPEEASRRTGCHSSQTPRDQQPPNGPSGLLPKAITLKRKKNWEWDYILQSHVTLPVRPVLQVFFLFIFFIKDDVSNFLLLLLSVSMNSF